MKIHKDIQPIWKTARKAGWTISLGGSGHLHFRSPAGALVVTSSTPTQDPRTVRNIIRDFRRLGLDV